MYKSCVYHHVIDSIEYTRLKKSCSELHSMVIMKYYRDLDILKQIVLIFFMSK